MPTYDYVNYVSAVAAADLGYFTPVQTLFVEAMNKEMRATVPIGNIMKVWMKNGGIEAIFHDWDGQIRLGKDGFIY